MKRAVLILLFAALPAQAGELVDLPRVIDGDTMVVLGQHVRLWGIDAPEMSEKGGPEAKAFLRGLTMYTPVSCEPRGKDTFGRTVALCHLLLGNDVRKDIAQLLVRYGFAKDWARYSNGYYARTQEEYEEFGSP